MSTLEGITNLMSNGASDIEQAGEQIQAVAENLDKVAKQYKI